MKPKGRKQNCSFKTQKEDFMIINRRAGSDLRSKRHLDSPVFIFQGDPYHRWYITSNRYDKIDRDKWYDCLIDALTKVFTQDSPGMIFQVADWFANGISVQDLVDDKIDALEKWLQAAHSELLTKQVSWENGQVPVSRIIKKISDDLEKLEYEYPEELLFIHIILSNMRRDWAAIRSEKKS